MKRFHTVVLDVDSTLSGIEGIGWLAARRAPEIAAKVAQLTEQAMEGKIPLDSVYGKRLALVKPTAAEVNSLGDAYVTALAPGADAAVSDLLRASIDVHLISGGLLPAVEKLGAHLGISRRNVHAVGVYFDDAGEYARHDEKSPLTRQTGKREVLRSLQLEEPVLIVGDGMTDAEAIPAVDKFAAFTGFVRRADVLARADHALSSFAELPPLVLE